MKNSADVDAAIEGMTNLLQRKIDGEVIDSAEFHEAANAASFLSWQESTAEMDSAVLGLTKEIGLNMAKVDGVVPVSVLEAVELLPGLEPRVHDLLELFRRAMLP